MKVTPLEIQNKTFRTALRGYHEEDVDEFLDNVSTEIDRLTAENAELRERADKNKDRLGEYRKMEQTLHNTLLSAQRLADEIKDKAEEEAGEKLREAGVRAKEMIEEAADQREEILASIERLRQSEDTFRTQLRGLMDQLGDVLAGKEKVVGEGFVSKERELSEKVGAALPAPEEEPDSRSLASGADISIKGDKPEGYRPAHRAPEDAEAEESEPEKAGMGAAAARRAAGAQSSSERDTSSRRSAIGFYDSDTGERHEGFSDLGDGVPGAMRRRHTRIIREEEEPVVIHDVD